MCFCRMKYHPLNIFPAEYLRREGTYYVCQYAINELKSLKFLQICITVADH